MLWDTIVPCTSNLPAFPIGIFICCLQILVKSSDSYFRQNGNTLYNTAIAFLYMAYSPFGILIGKTDIIVKSLSSDEKWRQGGQTEQSSFDVSQLISKNLQNTSPTLGGQSCSMLTQHDWPCGQRRNLIPLPPLQNNCIKRLGYKAKIGLARHKTAHA